jgi:tetratricopeptide (TPR) repeat protein
MIRRVCIFIYFSTVFLNLSSQENILQRQDIMNEIKQGLVSIYNYQFEQARQNLSQVQNKAPGHPATVFMEALILYWEFYPLSPEYPESIRFQNLLIESYTRAESMLEQDPENLEGIFFDLFAKAFYVMYLADTGRPTKVFPYLNMLYRQTIKGFELQESFNEFSFTTGLYNYYIIAYPAKYAAYRAVARLFKKGNKDYGISQLEHCAKNCIFLRVEANLYLSLIHLKYENDYRKASEYASALYREFPNNPLFTSLYAEILMMDNKFPIADVIIRNLEKSDNKFARLNGHILRGYYLEKYSRDFDKAFIEYNKGMELSESFAILSNYEKARAYMGMGRIHQRNHNISEANKNFKTAKNLINDRHVLQDK